MGVTVRELIDSLLLEDPDRLVVLSRDSEGNGYSPLSTYHTGAYAAENSWSGEVGLEKLTPSDVEDGHGPEDVVEDGEPCLVLVPTR